MTYSVIDILKSKLTRKILPYDQTQGGENGAIIARGKGCSLRSKLRLFGDLSDYIATFGSGWTRSFFSESVLPLSAVSVAGDSADSNFEIVFVPKLVWSAILMKSWISDDALRWLGFFPRRE